MPAPETPPADRIDAPWLGSAGLDLVMAALSESGATPRFVGGCVRNALIGAGATDLDIAIDAPPTETAKLLTAAGLRAIPTGIEHGTVTTLADIDGRDEPIEITSLRRDVATDGRRAVVAFTTDWREDAKRRDFTMNALYADAQGRVFDPLGDGVADLAARKVRFIGDPAARIREDYLRILRYFRFIAWYGHGPREEADLAAIAALRRGIAALAPERIGAELKKLFAAPNPADALSLMAGVGVVDLALPAAAPWTDATDAAVGRLAAIEARLDLAPTWTRRLAALIPEDADARALARSLRLSNADAAALAARLKALPFASEEAAYRCGAEAALDAAVIAAARGALRIDDPERLRAAIDAAAAARFPLKAADLIAAGAAPGPSLGAALKDAERDWIRHNFTLDRDALLAEALKKV